MALLGSLPLWSDANLAEVLEASPESTEAARIARCRLPAAADGRQEELLQRPEIDDVFDCALVTHELR
jgi:hypothetical protein